MKAKLFTFVRGLKNGTPPRFQSYLKALTLLLVMVISVNVWGADEVVATFESSSVVTNTTYQSYSNDDWSLSMGGNSNSCGFNKNNKTQIGNAYGTIATTTHHGYTIVSKNKLDNVYKMTFVFTGKSANGTPKLYLGYSTDGSNWSAVELKERTGLSKQGDEVSTINTTYTFEFKTAISSAYYAIIHSASQQLTTNSHLFRFDGVTATFYASSTPPAPAAITLSEAGSTTEVKDKTYYVGDTYELPSSDATCGDKTFVGWSTEPVDSPTKPTSKFYEPGEEVTLAATNTFYAVFADASEGGEKTYTKLSNNSFDVNATYVLVAEESSTSSTLHYFNSYTSTTSNESWGGTSTTASDAITFTLGGTASALTAQDASGNYIEALATGKFKMSSSSTTLNLHDDGTIYNPTSGSTGYRLRYNHNNGSGGFRWYNGTTGTSAYFYKVSGGTTYSNYTTTCSTPEPDYKVTVSSNNEDWGIAEILGSTISTLAEDGYRISTTNPYTIEPAGAATVTPQGTDKFLVSEVTEDCEITINFEQIPTYSVNFYINGIATPKSIQEGEKVIDHAPTTPDAFDPDFQTFVGWTTSAINGIAENEPTLITDETVTGEANYYAVFAGETLGNTYTWHKEKTLPDGNYLIGGYNSNDYLMKNSIVSSFYIGADNQGGSYGSYEEPDETNIWKLTTTTDGTTIYNEKIEKYVELYQDGSYYDLGFSSDPCYFAITAGDEVFTIKSKKYSSYYLYFDASHSNFVAKNNSSNLYLFKQDVTPNGYITNKTDRVTLHYDANAGEEVIAGVPQDARINKNEAFTLPTDELTRTGYTHLGWNESETATEAQATITPTEDVTVYAVWQVNSYTLTWELNGGTVTEEGTPDGSVEFGTTLTAPVLEKTGYTYTWSPAVPETMPASDATYSAVWKAKKTTVNFNFNLGKDAGGTAIEPDNTPTQSVTATYDAAMPSIKVLPQKEGKIFVGYSDKEVAKYYYNADGESQCVWDKDAKSATIYAQWQDKEAVTVSFADNMHENTIPTINTYSGETFTFPAALADQTPVAGTCQGEHSHFVGWVKTSDEVIDANIHAAGSTSGTLTGSESYLAVWAKVDGDAAAFDGTKGGDFYIAVYDSHSGSEVTYYATGSVVNSKLASTTDKSEATVYTFTEGTGDNAGKFSIKTGSDYIKYSSGTDLANSYDAYWWTITAKPEGMPGSWNIKSETTNRSLTYQSYSSKGSGANYEETESHLFGGYSTTNIVKDKDQYLYVEIEPVVSYVDYLTECCQTYDITLVDNGEKTEGTFMADPTSACEGTEITISQKANTGYTFKEYTFTKTGGDEINPDDLTFIEDVFLMPNYDITIDATFTANKHNVIFQPNGAEGNPEMQEFAFGVEQKLRKNTWSRDGFAFAGWATTSDGAKVYDDEDEYTLTEDNNVNLYAVWTADDAVAVSVQGTEHLSNITAPISISAKAKSLSFTYSVATGYKVVGATVTIDGTPVTEGVTFTQTNFSLLSDADFAGAIVITFDVQEILYTVTLNPGSGTCAQTELTQEHYGSAVTLPTPTIAADGWAFAGWAAAAVETETETAPTLYTGNYTPASDLTLYAVYKRGEEVIGDTYTCDFETEGEPEGWKFEKFAGKKSHPNMSAVSGDYFGATTATGYVLLNKEITGKYRITASVGSTSDSDKKGTFEVKVSGATWTTVSSVISVAGSSNQYKWKTLTWTGDLNNQKIEVYYTAGSTANRVIDNVVVEEITTKSYYHSTPSVVTDLKVTTKPAANIKYKEGETFNPAGIELTATYDNDKTKTETVTSEKFTCDFSGAVPYGETTVTFTYKGKTCTQTIIGRRLQEISIKTAPEKLEYVEGETFSNKSLSVNALFAFGEDTKTESVKQADLTYNPSLTTPLATTDTKVTISYKWADVTKSVDQAITVVGKVKTPTISPNGGEITTPTEVTLSCETESATIYYTTDETDPTTSATKQTYEGSFTVQPGQTVRAYAVREGWGDSEVAWATFSEKPVFDQGDWILVTDPAELTPGGYVIIANADYEVAMKSYASGDYCAKADATFSQDGSMLTYKSDFGVFELREYKVENEVKGMSFYDYNKKQYLYYSGSNNTLKAQDNQDATAAWTFSQDEFGLYIANYNSTTREIRYNNSATRFACYTSGQNNVQLYKYNKAVPKLIYDANGGENAPVPTRAENGNAVVTDQQPTWGGYEFVKWTENQDGSGKVYTATEEVPLTADLTIYAQWQEKQLEGTPMALVVKYGDAFYAMGKNLSAVEVEGIYNGNVVVVSEEIDQKAITWYRKDVEGGVTFQNCEELYLQGASSTNLELVEDITEATTWNWDNENQYYYTTIAGTKRSFFSQNGTFKNYAVSNIGTGSYSSAATCCEGIRVGEVFTRDMSNGFMGTHCYPFDIAAGDYKGAQFYEIAYRIGDTRIYFDQVDHVEAGVPYLVVPEDEENGSVLEAIVTPKNVDASNKNGFYGSYEQEDLEANSGLYIVYNNEFRLAGNYVAVGANRAYIKLAEVETNDPQQGAANAPRRISLRNSNAQSPTGIDNVVAEFGDSKDAKKVIVNGNFYIINQGKVYGAQGQLVK